VSHQILTNRQKISIQTDILPWRGSICSIRLMKKMVRSNFQRMCLFHICNNKLIWKTGNPRFWQYRNAVLSIRRVLNKYKIKDTWLLFNGFDEPLGVPENSIYDEYNIKYHGYPKPLMEKSYSYPVPVFSVSKIENFHNDILFPFSEMYKKFLNISSPSWEKKFPILFWRGATSGHSLHRNNQNHRVRFVKYFWNKPDMDVGFNKIRIDRRAGPYITRLNRHQKNKIKKDLKPYLKPHVSPEQQCNYKYLIDIDGNTYSMRLSWYLRTKSVILRTGIFQDILLRWLEPGIHYIPFELSFDGLDDILNILNNNDGHGKQIAQSAFNISENLLGEYNLDKYMKTLLENYSESIMFKN